MIRTLTILASLPSLAACNPNDLVNPGADSKVAFEYRASLIMAPKPEAPVVVHKPDCVVTYRVNRCDDQGNQVDWYYL